MSATRVAAEVRELGFAVLPDVISPGALPALRSALERCIDFDLAVADPRRKQDGWMVFNLMLRDPVFMELLVEPKTRAVVDELLGDTSILYAFVSSSMPPLGGNYSGRVHVDSQRVIPGYPTNLGVIVALDDFTEENGATYFLPRSFDRTDTPSIEEFTENAHRVFPRAGDAVVFNARTFHMGGTNETAEPRHAVTMNYVRSYMRQHFDFPRMIVPSEAEALGEDLRRVLGYHVRVPASLDEYYVDPSDRLYRAGQG